jgi:hypothetical protein
MIYRKEFLMNGKNIGYAEIEIPRWSERMEIIKGLSLEIKDETNVATFQGLDAINKIIEIVKRFIKKVEVNLNNAKIEDIEDLLCFEDGLKLIQELGGIVTNGIPLEKTSQPN